MGISDGRGAATMRTDLPAAAGGWFGLRACETSRAEKHDRRLSSVPRPRRREPATEVRDISEEKKKIKKK